MSTKSVTKQLFSVTGERYASRARAPLRGGVTLSRGNGERYAETKRRDSDSRPLRAGHHHHAEAPSYAKNPITHLQLAAMNLIADHEAGVAVDAHKLEFARRLLAGKAKA